MKLKALALITAIAASTMAMGQGDKYGETEEQQIKCKEALSLYRTYRDQDQLEDAYSFWKRACEDCPPKVTQRLYSDGIKFIKNEIKKAEGTARKDVLVDSLMLVHDLRREHFPETKKSPQNGLDVLGMKAIDMAKFNSDSISQIYSMLGEVVTEMGPNARATYNSNYYLFLYKAYKESEGAEKDVLLERMYVDYLTLQDNCDKGMKAATTEKAKEGFKKAMSNVDEIFVRIAECEQMVPVLESKVFKNPDDTELLKKALSLMNKKDCTDSEFYLTTADKVCAVEPSAPCKYALGIGFAKKGEFKKSLEYLEAAVELCGDCPDKELMMLKAGQVASRLGQPRKARRYASDVLAVNPKNAEAYMLTGDAIAGSASMCEDGKLGAQSVYWLAMDYYSKARNMDASLGAKISKKISNCKSQFPSREVLFGYTLKDGDSFTVPCWNESTTIRER